MAFQSLSGSLAAMLPISPPNHMLLVKPSLDVTFLDVDWPIVRPKALYSTGVNMMWLHRINDRVSMTVAANPSLSGDESEFGRRVRTFGMGALSYDWIPGELRVMCGAAWLGRRDIGVVPAAGVEWTPSDDWIVALTLPRPRIARRLRQMGDAQLWGYVAGSIAGGTFDVRRDDGTVDELSIREFRASLGVEFKHRRKGNLFLEIGSGFGRQLEFEIGGETRPFGTGIGLQMGWAR